MKIIEKIEINPEDIPTNLEYFKRWLNKILKNIPKEYKKEAIIYFDHRENGVDLVIKYERKENEKDILRKKQQELSREI